MGLDIDPVDTVEELRESGRDASSAKLNAFVAVTVAILATFLGIFNVKDDNIVQGMLAAQADKIDYWNFYQARNIREEVMVATAESFRLDRLRAVTDADKAAYDHAIARYDGLAKGQAARKEELKKSAEAAQATYDKLNYRDDQFDLSEAAIAIAIALLAITALTHFWWLFFLAMVPSVFGLAIGLAGLFGWAFHPAFLIEPLT